MMIAKIAARISFYFVGKELIGREDREVSAYVLECWIGSGIHLLILCLSAAWLGLLAQALFFQAGFSSLKRWAGGFHAGSHLSCIVSSNLLALGCSDLALLLANWGWQVAAIAVAVMLAVIFWKAPVVHPHNPKSEMQRRKCRRKAHTVATLQALAILLLLFLRPATSYTLAFAFGGAIAALSLLSPVPNSTEGGDNI